MTLLIHPIVWLTFPWQHMADAAAIDKAFDSSISRVLFDARHSERTGMNNNPVDWFEIYVQDMDRAKQIERN